MIAIKPNRKARFVFFINKKCGPEPRPNYLCLFLFIHSGDGTSHDFKYRLVRAANQKARIFDTGDGTDYAASRYDAIARLEFRDRLLQFALLLLLRTD